MRNALFVLVLTVIVIGCSPAAKPPVREEGCDVVYKKARGMPCDEPRDPARGGTWADVCNNAAAHGIRFEIGCYANASTCDAMKACARR